MSRLKRQASQISGYIKLRLRKALRRAESLERKMSMLFERSSDVRRWVAYQEADRRNNKAIQGYQADLAYYVLKEESE